MSSNFYNLDLDVTLGGNSPSDYKISSQKALKTYIDNNSGGGGTVDQVYDGTSANAQSGVAIAGAGFVTDISGKEDILKAVNVLSTSGTIALTDNSINTITPSGTVTFTLPTVTDNTKFHQILVQIKLSTVYTINLGLGATPHYFNSTAPDLSATGVYNLYYEYDKANQYWVGGTIEKGVEE